MQPFTCKQKGCTFEAEEMPELCPICNHPMIADEDHGSDDPDASDPGSDDPED